MPLLASRSARLAFATGALLLAGLAPLTLPATEESVASPDGQPAIVDSRLGLDYAATLVPVSAP